MLQDWLLQDGRHSERLSLSLRKMAGAISTREVRVNHKRVGQILNDPPGHRPLLISLAEKWRELQDMKAKQSKKARPLYEAEKEEAHKHTHKPGQD